MNKVIKELMVQDNELGVAVASLVNSFAGSKFGVQKTFVSDGTERSVSVDLDMHPITSEFMATLNEMDDGDVTALFRDSGLDTLLNKTWGITAWVSNPECECCNGLVFKHNG